MFNYISLGIIKIIDNLIATSKTLCIQRNKPIIVGLLVSVSQLLFFTVTSKVLSDGSPTAMLVVSVCAGIGSMIALPINNRFSEDITYINIITANNKNDMKELADYLRSEDIKVVSFDIELQTTLTILAFAKTRDESKIIDNYIDNSNEKYLRQITKAKK